MNEKGALKKKKGTSPKRHSTMKNDAANILMRLPKTAPAVASFPDYTPAPDVSSDAAGVTPAGTHIEEID